jgi:hypothetical protein
MNSSTEEAVIREERSRVWQRRERETARRLRVVTGIVMGLGLVVISAVYFGFLR